MICFISYIHEMWLWNKILTSIVSMYMLAWTSECSTNTTTSKSITVEPEKMEVLATENNVLELPNVSKVQKKTKKQISVCLKTDDENSFTHKKVLESITDPENTVLEFPLSQLFQKYWTRPHPLAVRWVKKNFRSLLWSNWIETLNNRIPQKLSPRTEKITSDTEYDVRDTLRFQLINQSLKWVFPKYLSDQLKEDWFQSFSDPDSSTIAKRIANAKWKKKASNSKETKPDFIYDIVVKWLPSWKSALALYRDWELFMATYVSVWLNSRKTKTWQFEILGKNAYYYSRKYKSPMPDWVNFDEWWFWFHQWNVTWFPASHWCVRQPWIRASVLFSSVKDANRGDVFIDKNLYKSKK